MRNQITLLGDDIGVPRLTRSNFRDHVPDILEVDLSNQHTNHFTGDALDRYRQSCVRLGFLDKIDRAEVRLALFSYSKRFVVGTILQVTRPAVSSADTLVIAGATLSSL